MLPYTQEIKASGSNYSVSEFYLAYRDTRTFTNRPAKGQQ